MRDIICSLKSKRTSPELAEFLAKSNNPVSAQHAQDLLVFAGQLAENMESTIASMENAFVMAMDAFPCLNRLAFQLFGSEKKYNPYFSEAEFFI